MDLCKVNFIYLSFASLIGLQLPGTLIAEAIPRMYRHWLMRGPDAVGLTGCRGVSVKSGQLRAKNIWKIGSGIRLSPNPAFCGTAIQNRIRAMQRPYQNRPPPPSVRLRSAACAGSISGIPAQPQNCFL